MEASGTSLHCGEIHKTLNHKGEFKKKYNYYCYYDHYIMSIKKGLVKEREGYLHYDTLEHLWNVLLLI